MTEMISTAKAQELAAQNGVALIGFKAPWCPQCGPQRGVVDRLEARYGDKMQFAYIDLEDHGDAQDEFDVSGLPTLLVYRDGKLEERLSGFTPAPKLNATLVKYI